MTLGRGYDELKPEGADYDTVEPEHGYVKMKGEQEGRKESQSVGRSSKDKSKKKHSRTPSSGKGRKRGESEYVFKELQN
ncbi:unnamed protein product [Strongylus vulgaris]|uniref:Uncharacterized protein n=1 Tax=Strongylus vulgaris TaxID=40348 RepID=A0A3P7IEW6_STRVU|nr:unnamed protein product [Strongylus vulgaris]